MLSFSSSAYESPSIRVEKNGIQYVLGFLSDSSFVVGRSVSSLMCMAK